MLNKNIYSNNDNHTGIYVKVLFSNFALAFLKLLLGVFGYSKLVLMDGILSFSNAIVLLLMWQGDRLERKVPDSKHPYGYGKIIFVVATFSGFIILLIAMYMLIYSINSMVWNEIHRSHSGAMMVTIISIFSNEILYRYLTENGHKYSNHIMLWNATNNRINTIVSSVILVCIILASVGVASAERIGVAIVSLTILWVSIRILLRSFGGIMDKIPSKHIIKQIKSYASKIEGVKFVPDIKARFIGSYLHVDLHIYVDENLDMKDADKIAHNVEALIINKVPLIKEINAIIS